MSKYLKLIFRDLNEWIIQERNKGISISRVLFYHLPLKLFLKSYSFFAALINIYFINRTFNLLRFKVFQNKHRDKLSNHFYIIIMPNTLHFLKPCIGLIPQNVNILFILNGTRICEENYLRDNYKDIPIFKLKTLPYSNFSHGRVLNLLIANNKSNFGIIDHDLYIFNKMIFNKMIFNDDEFVIGAFKITNKKSMLTFPTTHFMFFNLNLIKKIMLKYKIGAQKYRKIPSHLKNKLTTLNFGYHNFLKGYLNYFDTFNLVMAMAFYEKLSAKILKLNYFEDIIHIGGISHGSDNLYRTYINLKLLEIKENQLLREMYCDCFLEYGSSKDIVKLLPKQIHTFNYIRQIDSFTEKLEQYLYK